VIFLLGFAAFGAWLGALGGVCAAKLFRRPIRHSWIDSVLGITGFVVGILAYQGLMHPAMINYLASEGNLQSVTSRNSVAHSELTAGAIGSLLFPVIRQSLQLILGYLGKTFSKGSITVV
jgi:hypothetical protein